MLSRPDSEFGDCQHKVVRPLVLCPGGQGCYSRCILDGNFFERCPLLVEFCANFVLFKDEKF